MTTTFPNESPEYRKARDGLLGRERELRVLMEAVAAERRALPPGGEVTTDYVFASTKRDGGPLELRLRDLFAPAHDTLAIYNFMFPRDAGDERPGPVDGATARLPLKQGPCPSCTALLDQLEGAARHATQRISLAIVAKAPLDQLLAYARERGWRHLRLMSSRGSSYNRDYHGEVADGSQRPMLNVFHRDGNAIRHFWGSELLYTPTEPGQEYRHVGTLEPLWNLFDLTPGGRGTDWDEQIAYCCH